MADPDQTARRDPNRNDSRAARLEADRGPPQPPEHRERAGDRLGFTRSVQPSVSPPRRGDRPLDLEADARARMIAGRKAWDQEGGTLRMEAPAERPRLLTFRNAVVGVLVILSLIALGLILGALR